MSLCRRRDLSQDVTPCLYFVNQISAIRIDFRPILGVPSKRPQSACIPHQATQGSVNLEHIMKCPGRRGWPRARGDAPAPLGPIITQNAPNNIIVLSPARGRVPGTILGTLNRRGNLAVAYEI